MPVPYLIDGPALISFSGGRTSAYLLRQALDAHGGSLPADVIACFANTGKEMPQTLDFVRDCSERWDVEIVWLECDPT
jgi:3'-phosphoadenosine 5'-phosphosulfate sulfotransferase (PAPS reductase)/FAD synthetase